MRPVLPSTTPKTQAAPASVEICGRGRVAVDSVDPVEVSRLVGETVHPAAERWIARLKDSGDLRDRAAGLLLAGKISDGTVVHPMAAADRDELVQLAVGSPDPGVYAIAFAACGQGVEAGDPACARLSVDDWARRDPENIVPWLTLAARARARGDAAAEDAAFARAADARYSDWPLGTVFGAAQADLSSDATLLERAYLGIDVLGIELAMPMPWNGILSKHCHAATLPNSRTREDCAAVAELLVNHSNTLIEFAMGRSLGARLGWTGPRVAALERHQRALEQAAEEAISTETAEQWSCRGVASATAWLHERGQRGERAAAEARLEQSGETDETMAKRWDDRIHKLMATP